MLQSQRLLRHSGPLQKWHLVALRREDGKWLKVPQAKVELNRDSPDGQSHLCAPPPETEHLYENGVICFKEGGGT